MASQVGLEGLSIGTLAKAVGLSKSGLFAHFNSLENLQIAVLERASSQFIDRVIVPALRQPRGEPRLHTLFENWLAWEKAEIIPGGCPFIAASTEYDDRPGVVRDYLVQAQKDLISAIATAARIAVEEKHFRADLDTTQFAFDFYGIVLAFHHFGRLLNDANAEKHFHKGVAQLFLNARISQ